MRLASADLLPFEFVGLADTVARTSRRSRTSPRRSARPRPSATCEIEEGLFAATVDERQPLLPPRGRASGSLLRLLAPRERLGIPDGRREGVRRRRSASVARPSPSTPPHLAEVNRLLRSVEQAFLREEGLPRRPWYKHYLYAPGFYTGYAVKTLPAVREALEEKQWKDVPADVTATAAAIEKGAGRIREAAKALAGAP